MITASEIASDPELYNEVVLFRNKEWECMGYAKGGATIKFSRIEVLQTNKIRIINIYLKPYTILILKNENTN